MQSRNQCYNEVAQNNAQLVKEVKSQLILHVNNCKTVRDAAIFQKLCMEHKWGWEAQLHLNHYGIRAEQLEDFLTQGRMMCDKAALA